MLGSFLNIYLTKKYTYIYSVKHRVNKVNPIINTEINMPLVMETVSNMFHRKNKTKSHKRAPRRKFNLKDYLII